MEFIGKYISKVNHNYIVKRFTMERQFFISKRTIFKINFQGVDLNLVVMIEDTESCFSWILALETLDGCIIKYEWSNDYQGIMSLETHYGTWYLTTSYWASMFPEFVPFQIKTLGEIK
jgi:hypothetical protein